MSYLEVCAAYNPEQERAQAINSEWGRWAITEFFGSIHQDLVLCDFFCVQFSWFLIRPNTQKENKSSALPHLVHSLGFRHRALDGLFNKNWKHITSLCPENVAIVRDKLQQIHNTLAHLAARWHWIKAQVHALKFFTSNAPTPLVCGKMSKT